MTALNLNFDSWFEFSGSDTCENNAKKNVKSSKTPFKSRVKIQPLTGMFNYDGIFFFEILKQFRGGGGGGREIRTFPT